MSARAVHLPWRPSPLAGRLATMGALSAIAGLLVGRAALVALAVPCLVALAAGRRARRTPVTVAAATDVTRCVEGDAVRLSVSVDPGPHAGSVILRLAGGAGVGRTRGATRAGRAARTGRSAGAGTEVDPVWGSPDGPAEVRTATGGEVTASWVVHPLRWGRRTAGPVEIEVCGPARLDVGRVSVSAGVVDVHPPAAWARHLPLPPRLLQRAGLHASRAYGPGIEFAGVRAYEPGDVVRRVHWAASARRGRLHLTRYAAEHAADVVVVVDATTEMAGTLDLAVRGAAGTALAYLREGDRVGVVALGGMLRWLPPGAGARQVHRVVDAVLAVRLDDSFVAPDLSRLPRGAMPPGALVVGFSPLLDERVLEAVRDLRERGHPTVIVDVLRGDPPPPPGTRAGPQAVRLWRLERAALRYELEGIGVVVVPWGDDDHAPELLERIAVRLDPRTVAGGRR